MSDEPGPELVIRRALYDRLPGAAFSVSDGRDKLQVARLRVDLDELCQSIVNDLMAAEWIDWEEEDEAAELDAQVEELAGDWFTAGPCPESWPGYGPTYYRDIARKLVESGWRKGEPTP